MCIEREIWDEKVKCLGRIRGACSLGCIEICENRAGKSPEKEEAGSIGSAGVMRMERLCDVQGQGLHVCR